MGVNLLILRPLARRPTPAAPALSTSSLASSTTTSSTAASLHPLALAPVALSAMLQQVSMAPRTARLTASSAGASLAACPALSQRRRPLPHALDSKQAQPRLARPLQFEVKLSLSLANTGWLTNI